MSQSHVSDFIVGSFKKVFNWMQGWVQSEVPSTASNSDVLPQHGSLIFHLELESCSSENEDIMSTVAAPLIPDSDEHWKVLMQRPTSTQPIDIPKIVHYKTHTFEHIEAIYI